MKISSLALQAKQLARRTLSFTFFGLSGFWTKAQNKESQI
jgi:hypothetical protein